jgi:uncharacterized OB-fold protein
MPEAGAGELQSLSAPYVLEYPYHRSTGPIIGAFLGALRARIIIGIRAGDGRVIVPPQEYDPDTGETLSELVEVGASGVVQTWTWIDAPRANHPLQRPFAFALVKLDGADTPMLHIVDAGDASRMLTGMRVQAQWRDEPEGAITDLACFVPEDV